jgi:hypothetical protein
MKIECINGYYKFYPTTAMQITLLETLYGVSLVKTGGFYTFEALSVINDYSVKNTAGNGFKFNATYAGLPQDVLLANNLTIDLQTLKIVLASQIVSQAQITRDNLRFASKYLLQAYSKFENKRIKSFTGYYGFNDGLYQYDRLVLI